MGGGYWAVDDGGRGSESEIFTHTHCGSEIGRENLRSPGPQFLKGGDLSVSVSVFENIGTRSQITTREIFFFFFFMIAFFMIKSKNNIIGKDAHCITRGSYKVYMVSEFLKDWVLLTSLI